jgi:hypothetical protein
MFLVTEDLTVYLNRNLLMHREIAEQSAVGAYTNVNPTPQLDASLGTPAQDPKIMDWLTYSSFDRATFCTAASRRQPLPRRQQSRLLCSDLDHQAHVHGVLPEHP